MSMYADAQTIMDRALAACQPDVAVVLIRPEGKS